MKFNKTKSKRTTKAFLIKLERYLEGRSIRKITSISKFHLFEIKIIWGYWTDYSSIDMCICESVCWKCRWVACVPICMRHIFTRREAWTRRQSEILNTTSNQCNLTLSMNSTNQGWLRWEVYSKIMESRDGKVCQDLWMHYLRLKNAIDEIEISENGQALV